MDGIKLLFVKKIFSRKMIVWVVATILLCLRVITQDIWLATSIAYMGVNGVLAAVESFKINREVKAVNEEPKEEGEA